jgi:peptidoglycan/xylan/chitin deacetylase (PgdA/CDA1 family)
VLPLASISVDLDSPLHYCRIFGLAEGLLDEAAHDLIATRAIPRLLELLDGAPGTFFVVGADLARPALPAALRGAVGAGVELASHSFSHDYALSRRDQAAIAHDLELADQALAREVGVVPQGFRAPGYTLSPALLRAVAGRGYRYDSSAFPAAPYYLAKAAVMGGLALLGRPSRAVLDRPSVLLAPLNPYRPSLDAPYRVGRAPFVELPITVSPTTRVPFYGTLATLAPRALVAATYRSLRATAHVNFELHALDVLDVSDGLPRELAQAQRDLRVPAATKLQRLQDVVHWLKADRELVTVAQAARRFADLV